MDEIGIKKKIIDITPYATYPPQMGGQLIIHELNSKMPELGWQMEQFSLGIRKEDLPFIGRTRKSEHLPGYTEWRRTEPISVISFLLSVLLHSPYYWAAKAMQYRPWKMLEKHVAESQAVMVEAPWCYTPKRKLRSSKGPLIYMAHNAEFQLLEKWKKKLPFGKGLGNYVEGLERQVLHEADYIFTLSQQDIDALVGKYVFDQEKAFVLPRGIDTSKHIPLNEDDKAEKRKELGLSDKTLVIFVGSHHGPNVEAAKHVVELARQFGEEIIFMIAGSVTNQIEDIRHDKILYRKGDPKVYACVADIALNPTNTGSGLNIKMLEYFAFGLPVITTKFGARGVDGVGGSDYLLAEIKDFPQVIASLSQNKSKQIEMGTRARKLVEEKYSSSQGARKIVEKIEAWHHIHNPGQNDENNYLS